MHDPLKSIDISLRQSYTGHVSAKGLNNSHCNVGLVHITYHEANFPRHNLLTPPTMSEMQLINISLKISDCRGWPGIHLKVCVTTWWDRSNEINFKWDHNTSTGIWCQSWTQRMSQLSPMFIHRMEDEEGVDPIWPRGTLTVCSGHREHMISTRGGVQCTEKVETAATGQLQSQSCKITQTHLFV